MSDCKKYQLLFSYTAYGEMTESQKSNFENHLSSCRTCREAFNHFRETLDIMSKKDIPDPGNTYWDTYWQNLEDRMEKESVFQEKPGHVNIISMPVYFRKWTYRIISAAAILIAGIGIGYILFTKPAPPMVQNQTSTIPAKQAALNRETANYLESSKLLLLGFVNFDTDHVNPSTMDFSRQQELAKSLIKKTAVLKDELKGKENLRVLELIKELEIILLQISNYEKEFNIPAIDLIKSGVDNSSIMMKINIEELIRSAENEPQNTENDSKKMDL
jgi:hypothetical protein